ncbi:MAG TPA: hypothetical protein VFE23_06260 [Usitatibacter sp.]|jgi:hypothetical protein|nr:hypothetical protein [Usitatibacter sp.]
MHRLAYATLLLLAPCAWAGNDFPTSARVQYVLECMREYPSASPEAIYKCSCAIDAIAEKMTYEQWTDLATVANGITIAGERGGVLRDMKDGRKIAGTYRTIQEDARKRCFLAR